MKWSKWILLFGLFCITTNEFISAQERSFNDGYDDYGPYHYRTADEWERIREEIFHRVGMEDSLRQYTREKSFTDIICPWWQEEFYRPEVIGGHFRRLGYVGYVLDPLTGLPAQTNSWEESVLLDGEWQNIPLDLVVYCRGGDAFDYFLKSDSACMNFIHAVFQPGKGLINRLHSGRRPAGLHFYLPDFSFREKKAFIRFVRSVSMVIHHYCKDGERPYAGGKCRLTFTFSPSAKQELSYLSGVIGLVDEVHFTTYNEFGFPQSAPEVFNTYNDPTTVWSKGMNQFYFFTLSKGTGTVEQECSSDLGQLACAEYTGHNWRLYFWLDVLLVIGLIAWVVLYYLCSPFYMLIERYNGLMVPVVITLVTEIIIVFFYMIEALSSVQLFFDLDQNTHLFLLILPVLFILIYMGLKISMGNKQLP